MRRDCDLQFEEVEHVKEEEPSERDDGDALRRLHLDHRDVAFRLRAITEERQ